MIQGQSQQAVYIRSLKTESLLDALPGKVQPGHRLESAILLCLKFKTHAVVPPHAGTSSRHVGGTTSLLRLKSNNKYTINKLKPAYLKTRRFLVERVVN